MHICFLFGVFLDEKLRSASTSEASYVYSVYYLFNMYENMRNSVLWDI